MAAIGRSRAEVTLVHATLLERVFDRRGGSDEAEEGGGEEDELVEVHGC